MIVPTGAEAHTFSNRPLSRRTLALEGFVLLLAAPFLTIPAAYPIITFAALLALGIVWALSLLPGRRVASPFDIIIAIWCVVLAVGIMITADPAETLSTATNLVLGLGVWRFLLISVGTRKALAIAIGFFLLLCLGFCLAGITRAEGLPKIQLLTEFNPFQDNLFPSFGSLTVHPNRVAGLICLYLPLLVSLTFMPPPGFRAWLWRVLLAGLTLLTTLMLVFTQSRSGWVGSVGGMFFLAVMWGLILPRSGSRRALRLAIAGWVLVGVLALAWIGPTRLQETWLNPPAETALGTLTTLNYRKELWPWAITAIQDFPFTGVGPGAFRNVALRLYPPDLVLLPGQDIGHAHNIFLQTALDVGLPGLVAYLALLFVAGAVSWRVARCEPEFRSISLGLVAGLIAVHIYGLTDALVLGSRLGVVFWFSPGLLAAMNNMVSYQYRQD